MKRFLCMLVLLGAHLSHAYEYKLQFTPQAGAQGLLVAGYYFQGDAVVGNCSYRTVSSGSGRGGHGTTTYHNNTCTWDHYGNLTSMTPGAPVIPQPLTEAGTEIIYAFSGTGSTGLDTRGWGFVNTPSSHYSWEPVNGGYAVVPYAAYTITATLVSDGDKPLVFDSAKVATSVSGMYTPSAGSATVSSTTCKHSVPAGSSCSLTVAYNPRTIKCTSSPYGYAYTRIDLTLITDAGAFTDFSEGFTVTGVPVCDD